MSFDPTRTTLLRRKFMKEMNRRFKRVSIAVRKLILDDDVLGLKSSVPLSFYARVGNVEKQAWRFLRDADKVKAFRGWLKQQVDLEILSAKGGIAGKPWTAEYVESAYKKGMVRAYTDSTRAGMVDTADFYRGTQQEFLRSSFMAPEVMSKVELLYTRAYNDLEGVTDAMGQKMSRILADGLAQGKGPAEIARNLTNTISNLNKTRARVIARTEIIRAHAEGQLDAFEKLEIEEVGAEVEWSTAGDDRVCEECSALSGQVFKLSRARGMLPLHANCFVDGQTPIFTSKGWKPIKDVKIGTLVLTHKKRFRKVTKVIRTPKQRPYVVAIYLRDAKRNYTTLTVTEDHPILLDNKWKQAKQAKVGMNISYLAAKCKRCKKSIPHYRTYCSGRCNSLDITDRQWASEEHRENMSNKASAQLKREYKEGTRNGKEIVKAAHKITKQMAKEGKCPLARPDVREKIKLLTNLPGHRLASSKRMKEHNPMSNPIIRKKATESLRITYLLHPEKRLNARMAKLRKSGNMTWIEKRMSQLLDKLGIDYVFQYPILRYNVDFVIPALRIVIECDGEYWHTNKQKDLKRQRKIEKEGWFVLRYTGQKINQCLDEIENEVKRIIANHRKQYDFLDMRIVKVVKWKLRKSKMLYNFSVKDDESYIAKGFVVHNCRCAWLPVMRKKRKR